MVATDKLPSLSSIRAFEAAARAGSFAQAAAELGTTAASVSYHVRQLEQQLGMPLFNRHAQRVELTQTGAVIAREAMNAFAALRASFVRAVEVDESRLALTTLPTFGTSWLTPRLGEFRARYPGIALRIDVSGDAEDLNDGRFDAAIRNGLGRWPGMRAVKLLPSIFMPLCAPKLKSAAAAALANPRKALDVPLLGRPDWWTMWFRARGFNAGPSRDKFGTSLAHEYLDIAAAVAGQGIAIGSPLLFRHELDAGRLVPAHDVVGSDERAFWFIHPSARQHSRKLKAFGEWIEDEASAARSAGASFIRRMKSP
ncbi:MAG TPA: LysR substrate-binding domain-containing protein [Steroidobacteraceae bacterium]|nr:LysR substrate-binding domain-containing protein [Steroidobacteraceae bacterium]